MKFFLLLMFLIPLSVWSADNELSEQEKEAGWELLFDGKSLEKWKAYKKDSISKIWSVVDGQIKVDGRGGGENGADIITKKTYKNFEFKVEWKMPVPGNSGIFILADEKAEMIYHHAPEIQVLATKGVPSKPSYHNMAGSLYGLVQAPVNSQKKTGEWNKVRIVLKDSHLKIWQNGVPAVDIVIDSPEWKKLIAKSKFKKWAGFAKNVKEGGALGLQDHGCVAYFKNLKVKGLD